MEDFAKIKQKCFVHGKEHLLPKNYPILVYGEICGLGADKIFNELIDKDTYYKLVEKAIDKCPNHEFANEEFGGRTSDPMFTVMDFIGSMNICSCPKVIEAFKVLYVNQKDIFESNIMYILADVKPDFDDEREIQKCFENFKSRFIYADYKISLGKLMIELKDGGVQGNNFDWLYDVLDLSSIDDD